MPEPPEDETDPRIEQALRLGELRKEVMDRTGGPAFEGGTGNLPMDTQESFWEYVLAFESAERTTLASRLLKEADFVAQDPDALDGPGQLQAALWELLHALASIRVYAHFTDHLDDASAPGQGSQWGQSNFSCFLEESPMFATGFAKGSFASPSTLRSVITFVVDIF